MNSDDQDLHASKVQIDAHVDIHYESHCRLEYKNKEGDLIHVFKLQKRHLEANSVN